jgi:hypothetical protein
LREARLVIDTLAGLLPAPAGEIAAVVARLEQEPLFVHDIEHAADGLVDPDEVRGVLGLGETLPIPEGRSSPPAALLRLLEGRERQVHRFGAFSRVENERVAVAEQDARELEFDAGAKNREGREARRGRWAAPCHRRTDTTHR